MEKKLPHRIEKPWGFELLIAHTPKYAGKVLFVKRGHRLSLHYHRTRDESVYVFQGKALLEIEGGDGQLLQSVVQAGYCLRIPPLTRHRLKAIEDTTIFEASTFELDDIERLEDDYGRAKPRRD